MALGQEHTLSSLGVCRFPAPSRVAELSEELWGSPGAFGPSYTWSWWVPLNGLHVSGPLTTSLESQLEGRSLVRHKSVPQPLLAGELTAPFTKSWQFQLPGIALPHKKFCFQPSTHHTYVEPQVGP